MQFPSNLKYTEDHEWALIEGNLATVGITSHAQNSLGDIVYVEMPQIGRDLKVHETFGVVESIKAVSELYSPVAGRVIATNAALLSDPSLVNHDAHERGWMIRLELADPSGVDALLDSNAYSSFILAAKK